MPTERRPVQMRLSADDDAMLARIRAHHNLDSDVAVVRYLLAHEVRRIEDYEASRPSAKPARKPKKSPNPDA